MKDVLKDRSRGIYMNKWTIWIKLKDLDTVKQLCALCEKFKNMDIDVKYGSSAVDGRSVLGVASFLHNEVEIVPISNDENYINSFYLEVEDIGAYIKEKRF